jgi:hypothetical protein
VSLEKGLPELLSKLNNIPSMTIGINLDSELRPVEATLLAIHDKPFKGGTMLDRLMGMKKNRKEDRGIGPLHFVPYQDLEAGGRIVRLPTQANPLLIPLFRDLHEVLRSVIAPISIELGQYAKVNARFLIPLEMEIAFYLGAVALVKRMRVSGLPMCCPVNLPIQERTCRMRGMFNLLLALRLVDDGHESGLDKVIVLNDVDFGSNGRVFILTGSNLGGKTIYTQAMGLSQMLFQAGLFVPAKEAQMSPVDGLYSHFATLENADSGMGRLGDEAKRLNAIFQTATDQSLILLNESLSCTSPGESLYLAQDIVRALRLFGVRAIFATHLYELAEGVNTVNEEINSDSRVVSLVAGVALQDGETDIIDDIVPRTYQIKPGPPRGLSYAKGIATRHGISFEQLAEQWRTGSQ